jgi:hypothetical protein
LAHDLRHGYAFSSQRLNFFYKVRQELGLPAKLHAPISRFGNSVHLPFTPDVILELGNQRKNAHDELPGAGSGVDGGSSVTLKATSFSASSETMR